MALFSGIYPASVTPLDSSGRIARDATCQMVDYHLAAGVDGFYVGGSTGEGILQSVSERLEMVEIVHRHVRGRAKIIVHVGAPAAADAIAVARGSAKIGADAVSSVPPIYYKMPFEGVRRFYEEVAAATDLPLLAYYIPVLSGITHSVDELCRLMDIPHVEGIKFSDYNFYLLERLRKHRPDKTIFSGNDEVFLGGMSLGADGSIGLTLNYMPEIYVGIYRAFRRGDLDEAQRLQRQGNSFIEIMFRYPMMGACKGMMRMLGINCGQPRSPLMGIDDEQYESLKADLTQAGFFNIKRNGLPSATK